MNLGSHLEASGHQLLMKKMVWNMFFPHMLSEWFMGMICVGSWSSRATLESEKTMQMHGRFVIFQGFTKEDARWVREVYSIDLFLILGSI